MDDLTREEYEDEWDSLQQYAQEFALAHPDRADTLLPGGNNVHDPYVDRLEEGLVFNLSRMRKVMDATRPQHTQALLSLLWPHYLRTVPSLSIVELCSSVPLPHSLYQPAGLNILSRPVGLQRTRLRYRTTRAITLHPITLEHASNVPTESGRSLLRLRFQCQPNIDWQQVDLSTLPLYLNAEQPVRDALYEALTRQVSSMVMRLPDASVKVLCTQFLPLGLGDDDLLWPEPTNAFSGYRLLLEYFNFCPKFMFLALRGLNVHALPFGTPWFELDILLNQTWPASLRLSARHIRLYCSPVINLFDLDADPLTLSGLEHEILLRPLRIQDGHTEIYSVDQVLASPRHADHYEPFNSFKHYSGMLRPNAPGRYYHTYRRRNALGLYDTYLTLGGSTYEADRLQGKLPLFLTMTGTQDGLPDYAWGAALLDSCVRQHPEYPLLVRNLYPPTTPCHPPTEDRMHWRVLSHLGANFQSLLDNPDRLRGVLALYDWSHSEMNRRRLASLVDVRTRLHQQRHRGVMLWRQHIEITLREEGFNSRADIRLFGAVLQRFFAVYADLHIYNELTLILQPSAERLHWRADYTALFGEYADTVPEIG